MNTGRDRRWSVEITATEWVCRRKTNTKSPFARNDIFMSNVCFCAPPIIGISLFRTGSDRCVLSVHGFVVFIIILCFAAAKPNHDFTEVSSGKVKQICVRNVRKIAEYIRNDQKRPTSRRLDRFSGFTCILILFCLFSLKLGQPTHDFGILSFGTTYSARLSNLGKITRKRKRTFTRVNSQFYE